MGAKQRTKPAIKDEARSKLPGAASAVAGATSLVPGALALQLLVFVSGAVLMGLEIVGSRILAPYFGNSVFVWGSLISLFLIALSLGYYLGGRLADRRPSRALLNTIVIAVAASMFLVAAIGDSVSSAIVARGFGEKSGPFLAATVLFLLPSVGMGVVSPFAVRLATHTVASVGKTAGTLYALSTLGSIAGTMITTFVLIPWIGAGMILKGLATVLLATAVGTFPFGSRGGAVRGSVVALAAAALCLYGIDATGAALPPGSRSVLEANTPYHHISVVDSTVGGRQVRELRFDRYIESAIELAPPYRSLTPYTSYFHLAFLPKPDIRRALFIGAGGGAGPRAFHMHDPEMEIDVVDIDAEVLRAAHDYFYMERTPKIRAITADGRSFVRQAARGAYDAIILDAFTIGGRIPFHLVTQEFFELCRDKLSDGGVLVMNINSAVKGPLSPIFHSMYKTIDSVFPGRTQAFVLGRELGAPPTQSTNIMLVAVNGSTKDRPALSAEEWRERAEQYESRSYVGRELMERMVRDLAITLPDFNDAALFTDDYAPIETMPFDGGETR
jgi:spermidine synthase